ncbi:MAG: hypothetical protein IPN54_02845 [Bacteroidetes bacterium]|nr:hypothetical protein [Bacteroidota bacterium]
MDTNYRGFDFGPLGKIMFISSRKLIGWSNDNKTITIEVEVEPNKNYQALITNRFINKKGLALKPFLIEFRTTD